MRNNLLGSSKETFHDRKGASQKEMASTTSPENWHVWM